METAATDLSAIAGDYIVFSVDKTVGATAGIAWHEGECSDYFPRAGPSGIQVAAQN
jgi:hypothetical protein